MIRRIATFLLLALLTSLLGGCWSRKEITEVAIVLGCGVDWTGDNRMRLTVQIARPGAFYGGGEGGAGQKGGASWVLSAEGKTVEEAGRFLNMKVPREIYWGHCIVLIIGEEMAKKGTGMVTNFFMRDRQPRETIWVMVAKGEAKDILETHSELAMTSAQAAGFLARMRTGYSVQLREFAGMLASKGVQPVVDRIEVREAGVIPGPEQEKKPSVHKHVEISGLAVFKEDKLIGWLDATETRGLLWLKDAFRKGMIIVPSLEEPDKEISINVRRGKTKIEPEYDGNRVRFKVKVTAEGDMIEQQSREDLAKPEKIKELEKQMAEDIKGRTTMVFEKAQTEFGLDIFGFGEHFHRKYKKDWREVKDRWDEVFKQAELDVTVEAHVRGIGLLTKRATTEE